MAVEPFLPRTQAAAQTSGNGCVQAVPGSPVRRGLQVPPGGSWGHSCIRMGAALPEPDRPRRAPSPRDTGGLVPEKEGRTAECHSVRETPHSETTTEVPAHCEVLTPGVVLQGGGQEAE